MNEDANNAAAALAGIAVDADDKCGLCSGSKCCRYITQALDPPRSMKDFDHLLWQVSHRNIALFKDDDGWYLLFNDAVCTHLRDNGACAIYDVRPQICREHSNDYCEYDAPAEDGFDLYFDGYASLDAYCRKRFKKWDKRFKKWNDG